MTTREEAKELLNNTHEFPCAVMIKAIGQQENDFPARVVAVVRVCLQLSADPEFTVRDTQGGRHVGVTLDPIFANADQVLDVYEALKNLEGIVMVM